MRFLADDRLYQDTDRCLEWLRGLEPPAPAGAPGEPEPCHLYWEGTFGAKQAVAARSFLATQDLGRLEPWLWLDAENGYEGHATNPFLEPLLPLLRIERFDAAQEARGTPAGEVVAEYRHAPVVHRSNLFRFVVLHKHGGLYSDLDMLFLRDLGTLVDALGTEVEWAYRWSAHMNHGNNGFMRLHAGGTTSGQLLHRGLSSRGMRSRDVLRFEDAEEIDLLILPSAVFDPLWAHHDRRDVAASAPFDRFEELFRSPRGRDRGRPGGGSLRDFFPGAFAFHWHNHWSTPVEPGSPFARLAREFDGILLERLGIAALELPTTRRRVGLRARPGSGR
jgi:hypothetical protein